MGDTTPTPEGCRGCGGVQVTSATGRALRLVRCQSCGTSDVIQTRGLSWTRADLQIAAAYHRWLANRRGGGHAPWTEAEPAREPCSGLV